MLLPADGWDSLAGQRLSEQGTVAAIEVEDGQWLPLKRGGRLTVEFASTLPAGAVIIGGSVEISLRSVESLAVPTGQAPAGEAPLQLRVSVGTGDLRDPVVSASALSEFGGEEAHSYAAFALGDQVMATQDIVNLRVTIEAADGRTDFEIDAISLFVSYHGR